MGMFDGILGGIVGAEMATVVNGLIEKHGGISGIVSELQHKGLGDTVKSWVGTGPNQAISPDQLHQAAKSGLSTQDLLAKLSSALPAAVDKLTPGGVVPKA
jgi:uncharacterized protein YidB (DUF937 family)